MVSCEVRTIRVFLVTEHPSLQQSLALLLEEEGMVVCGRATDAEAALREMPEGANLVLVGLSGGGQGGLGLLWAMRQRPDFPPVLVLSANDDAHSIGLAIAAGARGYVSNRQASQALVHAIREVVAGRSFVPRPAEPREDPRLRPA